MTVLRTLAARENLTAKFTVAIQHRDEHEINFTTPSYLSFTILSTKHTAIRFGDVRTARNGESSARSDQLRFIS